MSNIYILEPPTSGKVLLKTTVGDIDIELWAKETPKSCRNFIQLCLEGYYDNLTFHRVVRGFIAQGGDPSGDGSGGESIYGAPFKDEFHQRLRFARRGLLAMANAGKDDNGSQFFFTLGATPELQNKHTLFGKITGDTVFNMLKLEEGIIKDETPEYPHKILKTEVLNNPFTDIVPRNVEKDEETADELKKRDKKDKGVKDYKLLSFGEEAEEDEVETSRENVKYSGKSKSTHDILDDPKLSKDIQEDLLNKEENEEEALIREKELENIKSKLSTKKEKKKLDLDTSNDDADINEYYLNKDRNDEQKKKMEAIKKEIASVKKDYQKNKQKQQETKIEDTEDQKSKAYVQEYALEYGKYVEKKKELPSKGVKREQLTLQLLEKFKGKLASAKENAKEKVEDDDNVDDEQWMSHELNFASNDPVLAKDANRKDDDWFEIYDPRNPINKRRRGEETEKAKRSRK